MSLVSMILKAAAPVPKPEAFSRYLFIGPHPDDIEIGAGATAAAFVSAGKEVHFLICLDGRFGLEYAEAGTTEDALAEIRKAECLESAAALGVSHVHFLGLSDGGFYTKEALREGIAGVIGEVQPDILFAPDPCVPSECHEDHLNVGEAVRRLAYFSSIREIMERYGARAADVKAVAYYMTAKPNRFVKTTGFKAKQTAAIRLHKSQFPEGKGVLEPIELYLDLRRVSFGLRSFKGSAEGFRVLGKTQMHCLPEAGL